MRYGRGEKEGHTLATILNKQVATIIMIIVIRFIRTIDTILSDSNKQKGGSDAYQGAGNESDQRTGVIIIEC